MKFWLLFASFPLCACAHNPRLEAFDRALELLVARAVTPPPSRDCADVPDHAEDDSYETGSMVVLIDVPPAPNEKPSDLTPDQQVLVDQILGTVFCGNDIHDEIMWKLAQAESMCRDAWSVHDDDSSFGPEESEYMLEAKVGFESLIADCGGAREEFARASDFYAYVWKPGDVWGPAWDGCFGTPLDRQSVDGAVLEYY